MERNNFNRNSGSSNGGNRGGFQKRDDGPRELHDVTCSECGAKTKVPFKPTEGRDVFCKECYSKKNPRY